MRWLLIIVALLFGIYLALLLLLQSNFLSRKGAELAMDFVPALRLDNVRGDLVNGLRLELRYQTEGLDIQGHEVDINIGSECIWQLALCIDGISIDELIVDLIAGDEAPSTTPPEAIELPEINLPFKLALDSLIVKHLDIRQRKQGEVTSLYQADDLSLSATWQGSDVNLTYLRGQDPYCGWDVEGEIALRADYPLGINVGCELFDQLGEAHAQLGGSLGELSADLNASLQPPQLNQPALVAAQLKIEPLQPELPSQINVQLREAISTEQAGTTLNLREAEVDINGELLAPQFDIRLVVAHDKWEGDNHLHLQGNASTTFVELASAELMLPDGQINAEGRLEFGEALNWQGNLNWRDLNGRLLREDLEFIVSGQATQQVSWEDENLSAHVELQDLRGNLFDKALQAKGIFDLDGDQLRIGEFRLTQGNNSLRAHGLLSAQNTQQLVIDYRAAELTSLWPDLEGASRGRIELSGSLGDISVNADLSAENIAVAGLEIGSAKIDGTLHQDLGNRSSLNLSVGRFALNETTAANLQFQWRGTLAKHTIALDLQGLDANSDKQAELACAGGFLDSEAAINVERWIGACEQLAMDFQLGGVNHHWENNTPLEIDARPAASAVSVSNFCLVNLPARICSPEFIVYENQSLENLDLNGTSLPVAWFAPWLPEGAQLEGNWGFRVNASNIPGNPDLQFSASSDDLLARWQTPAGEAAQLNITETMLSWDWQGEDHRFAWELASAENGRAQGHLNLNIPQGQQQAEPTMEGELVIDGLQLLTFSRLLLNGEGDEIAGEVNAQISVAGNLNRPILNGQLSLTEGRVLTNVLPVPITGITLSANLDRNLAVIDGGFSAADGDGTVDGEFDWRGESWKGSLSLKADQLVISPQDKMQITLAPDVQLKVDPERLELTGDVRVPEANIELEELPESAVTVSSDTMIVGDDDEEVVDKGALQISTNLNLALGDKVFFKGFGLETRIAGKLNVRQTGSELMQGRGVLSLREGRYEAYGQNLEIRDGDLVFVNEIDNPQLRLEAVRADIQDDVVVGLRASGSAQNPRITLFSQPEMPQQAKLSYLLTGNAPGAGTETDPTQAATQAALSYALESDMGLGVTRRAGQALGIDDLKVTADAGDDGGTQIGLSGYLSPNLMVSYGVGVFDAMSSLSLRYRLTKNVFLEAVSGDSSSLELLWSFERD